MKAQTAHVFGRGRLDARGLSKLELLAQKCFVQAHKKHEPAVVLLVAAIKKDKALTEHAIRRAAVQAIAAAFVKTNANADQRRHDTMRLYSGGKAPFAPDPIREEAMKQIGAAILREFVKSAGKFLGDMTKDLLLTAIGERQKQTRTMRARTRFYQLLAEGLKPGQTVGERYTGDELLALRQQAEKEITD